MKKNIAIFTALLLITIGTAWWMRYRTAPASAPKIYRIGILSRGKGSYEVAVKGFQERLREFGYVEGQNVAYDIRYVSTPEELDKAANDFAAAGVDLINTYSTPATQAAFKATQQIQNPIPVVFASIADPIAAGVVNGIQESGTNATGVISLSTELTAKRIEFLARIVPGIKRIAMPRTAEELNDVAANKSAAIGVQAAKDAGIELTLFPVHTKEENASTSPKITGRKVQGMIVGGDSLIWSSLDLYIKQAIKEKIPFSAFDTDQVKRGALIGFGPDYAVMGQQAATISHQILQGKKPGEIPIETPRKLLLSVNLDTARAIGITLDPQLIKEADVVIGKQEE
ncbi:MAG: ABC transporter substrate-binding protein [Candidatus Sungbacteria bacterium]|nr:ABC transporter substrate-binding protein [Candidatus Sungbacteria bacterium]